MGWFGTRGGLEGLVGVSGFAVSAPPKPVEPAESLLPDSGGYNQPPKKGSSLKAKLALLGGAGLIFLGGVGGAYFLFSGGQRGVVVPAVTPTASPRPTPTIDASYYEPQPTPTLTPVRIPTPTRAMVLPTLVPSPVPTTTPYFVPTAYFFPTAEPTETPTPVPTATFTPAPSPTAVPGLENILSREQLKLTLNEVFAYRRPNGVDTQLWLDGKVEYTDALIADFNTVTLEDLAVWKKIEAAEKTVYYMLTGRTFEQDRFVLKILRPGEVVPEGVGFRKADGTLGVLGTIARNSILDNNTYVISTEIYVQGVPNMFKDGFRDLVALVDNETGNAFDARWLSANESKERRAERNRPGYVEPIEQGLLGEASKSIYQAAAQHFKEELGVKGLTAADTPSNREMIRFGVEMSLRGDVSNLGWAIGWWYALNDTDAGRELAENGRLNSATAMRVHEKMLHEFFLKPEDYKKHVSTALAEREGIKPRIMETAVRRLVPDGEIKALVPGDAIWLFIP